MIFDQTIINMLIATAGAFGGWILKNVHQAVRDLQTEDRSLADKVAAIEVLVAGQYVRRDDLDKLSAALFIKLDRIEEKLDGKVDK